MGGCYSYDYVAPTRRAEPERPKWETKLKKSLKDQDRSGLTEAYKLFFQDKNSGFILEAAKALGVSKTEDIPKEFPEFEYEFKFDMSVSGKGAEPSIASYLDSFDFPVARSARFLKDPVNSIATGTNRFYGINGEEKLVVITKGDRLFLKEKGEVLPISTGVAFEDLVMKRSEIRYPVDIDSAIDKMSEIAARTGAVYQGRIRKEKGDVFILDTNDGRLYGFTVTRAHLTRPKEDKESLTQRQLEIEYAGYLPGFSGFKKDSEKQIVSGMVDLARYTFNMYMQTPLSKDWDFNLVATRERKFDFVSGIEAKRVSSGKRALELKLN